MVSPDGSRLKVVFYRRQWIRNDGVICEEAYNLSGDLILSSELHPEPPEDAA